MVYPGMGAAFRNTETFSSWGRVVRGVHEVAHPNFSDELAKLVAGLSPDAPGLATGLRRSYGDSNLNPGARVIDMSALDRLIAFDRETGVMRAEAGASLSHILAVLVSSGWFLPTTPGTRFVTLGGAVANDVHGKNHHSAGSFGNWVTRLRLLRTDGGARELAPGDPLFHATIGGLGLTGVIEWVEFRAVRIPSAFIEAEERGFAGVNSYFDLAEAKRHVEHTVAWIDCSTGGRSIGRGVYSSGAWSDHGGYRLHADLPKKKMPVDAPGFALNPFSVAAYNTMRHALKSMAGCQRQHYEPFFYPLDGVADWNRLYGREGFYQYQCVIPPATAREAISDLLKLIARSGQASFLAVLKDMGPIEPVGLLSFPREGTTLALDFPNRGEKTLKLMAELDGVVAQAGGRLYPAKDGRISADMFQAGFPKWQEFRAHVDPGLSSAFWRRVSA
ncbi:MAG TPA: FAD-binding oxidoreductase [Hyphomonadaceae bacterium]|nr:FAD-binding oxidoreductase [Hyphomonadaceae bacterium]